jgi:hypothetical protein
MTAVNVNDARCEALFVSGLQRSDAPTAGALAAMISAAVRQFGVRGCACRMAQEFGDHPEAAADRMRWIRRLVTEAPVLPPPRAHRLGGRPRARCCPDAEAPAAPELQPAA